MGEEQFQEEIMDRIASKYSFAGCVAVLKQLEEATSSFQIANQREPTLEEKIGYLFRGEWFPEIAKAASAIAGKVIYGDPASAESPDKTLWITTPFQPPLHQTSGYLQSIQDFFEESPFRVIDFDQNLGFRGEGRFLRFKLAW